MRKILYGMALMALAAPLTMSAQEYDDIYYNPKKDNTVQTKSKKQSNYIKDFSSVDVDEYNRRGQYYSSPIDTIGSRVENDEDFVYTQQIQKYYNPTIVLDNSDVLADVLNNSYGNVEIVFNNGIPSFSPWYGYYDYGWPYYSSFGWNSWNWGWNSWNWGWGPSWSWNWGPSWNWSWGWGPSWSWGWNNPSWGWGGPGWGGPSWGWGHGRPYADYRPGGRLPNNPGSNWASNTRPGGNYNGHYGSNGSRPNTNGYNHNSGGIFGGSATNHHRTYGGSIQTSGNRNYGVGSNQSGSNRNGYTVNNNGHRTYNSSGSTVNSNNSNNSHRTYNNSSNRSNSNTTTRNSYNSNSSRGSYNSGGSFGGGRSSGGSYGGGRSSGGGGARGSHR